MELAKIFEGVDKNVSVTLLASLLAFISYLTKGLIETPLKESKETFFKFFEKRIELLSDVKVRLSLISYFPKDEGKEFKEQLQKILLTNGKSAYLDSDLLQCILKISIEPNTDEELLIKTIEGVDNDLSKQIGKVQELNYFFTKYSNAQPIKKILGLFLLGLSYILSIVVVISIGGSLFYFIIIGSPWEKIILLIISISIIWGVNKWISK